jgi:hypothetical protein
MSVPACFVFASAVLLTGCEHTDRVVTGTLQLTQTPVVVRFEPPVTAYGPTRELCLVGSAGNVSAAAQGGTDAIRAVLLTSRGARDTLDTRNVERRGDEMICFWDNDLEGRRPGAVATYAGVELSTSHFLRAREVRWWSGQRKGFF